MEQRVSAWECWAVPTEFSILLAQLAPFQTHTLRKSSLDQMMCDTCTQSKCRGGFSTHLPISAPGGRNGVSYSSSRFAELRTDLKLCSDSKQQGMLKQWKEKKPANLSRVSKESCICLCCFWGERCQSLPVAAPSCKNLCQLSACPVSKT